MDYIAFQAPLVNRILQARILEWVAVPSSRECSRSMKQTHVSFVSCIPGRLYPLSRLGSPKKTLHSARKMLLTALTGWDAKFDKAMEQELLRQGI